MTCRWRRRWNFPVQALPDGRFAATNLRPALARLGHDLPLISAPDRTPEGLDHSETCRPIYSSFSAKAEFWLLARLGRQCAAHLPLIPPIAGV